MDEKLKKAMIAGIIFTMITGTLMHFIYDWSGQNCVVGIFGAVNESTWEHLKLLFWPMFFYCSAIYFFFGKKYENYLTAMLNGLSLGLIAIITIFYTYTGIVGTNYFLLDILTYVIAVIWSFSKMYYGIINGSEEDWVKIKSNQSVAKLGLIALVAAFSMFTYYPPSLGIFLVP